MSLFPLPVVPFEHYMLADDRPDYPTTFFVRVKIAGTLDRPRFVSAVNSAVMVHPLLRAHVRGDIAGRTSQLAWVAAHNAEPFLDWDDAGVALNFSRGVPINLHAETGLRLWVRCTSDTTKVVLQIHHACSDGLGAMQFLETVLTMYGGNNPAQMPCRAEADLCQRNTFGVGWMRRIAWACRTAGRVSRFFKHRPVPIAVPEKSPRGIQPRTAIPVMWSYRCSELETEQIQAATRSQTVPLFAILLRDWILMLDDWNKSVESPAPARPLRIVIPVSLREDEGPRTAHNAVSLAFIDRDAGELDDESKLLAELTEEIDEAKQMRRGMVLLPALRLVGMVPGEMQRQLRADRCLGSAIFSNLGVPYANSALARRDGRLETAGLVMESVEAVAPLRPLTHVAMAMLTFANRLQFTLSCDPHVIGEGHGRLLLTSFVNRVCRTAAITTPSGEWLPGLVPLQDVDSHAECV